MEELDWSDTTGRDDVRAGEHGISLCLAQCIVLLSNAQWNSDAESEALELPDEVERLLERAWRKGVDLGGTLGWDAVRKLAEGPEGDVYADDARNVLLQLHGNRGEAMGIVDECSHAARRDAEMADCAVRMMASSSGERASSLLASWRLGEGKRYRLRVWESPTRRLTPHQTPSLPFSSLSSSSQSPTPTYVVSRQRFT